MPYFYHVTLEILPPLELSDANGHTGGSAATATEKTTATKYSPDQYFATVESFFDFLRPFETNKGGEGDGQTAYKQPQIQQLLQTLLGTRASEPGEGTSPSAGKRKADLSDADLSARLASASLQDTNVRADTPSPDKRTDLLSIKGIDMTDNQRTQHFGSSSAGGPGTRGRYTPLDLGLTESVYGIVHLYRDSEESPYLENDNDHNSFSPRHPVLKSSRANSNYGAESSSMGGSHGNNQDGRPSHDDEMIASDDCTMLCILAVPSYMLPSDFLGFVGEKAREEVSHFRMIRTARANRYMVLMKFRDAKDAKKWQKEWNGKVFNAMDPETCHAVFVKGVEIQIGPSDTESQFPDMKNDPFTFSEVRPGQLSTSSSKPLAPPTPSLIELPTCPVCLERMDETTGLLTIICQHVFHCTCLNRWKGTGCPVCRYTQEDIGRRHLSFVDDGGPSECSVCHAEGNLWICLICSTIGCGRYDGAHALDHFNETSHSFALNLSSQRVWDYISDDYVHRIIQGVSDGKLVELPGSANSALDPPDWGDAVPREKFENITLEYTHLLTSQLESQRIYFEEQVERAADKASKATASAVSAQEAAERLANDMERLQLQYSNLMQETIPSLERDKARSDRRAEKFESMSRTMEKQWREEKTMNTSLMERVQFLDAEVSKLKAANEDLTEQNRDLTFFISGTERLKNQSEEVVEGTISVPDPPTASSKRKGKRKAKK